MCYVLRVDTIIYSHFFIIMLILHSGPRNGKAQHKGKKIIYKILVYGLSTVKLL